MSPGRHAPVIPGTSVQEQLDSRILHSVRERALAAGGELDTITLAGAIHDSGVALGSYGARASLKSLQDEVAGLSILEQFAAPEGVTDVLVDGQGQVWTDSPHGLALTGFRFSSPEEVRNLAVHLAALAGRRLDAANPFMDMSVKNYRVHAVLPPIATEGPLLSIRVKVQNRLSLSEVLAHAPEFWRTLLAEVLARRLNFLITGGTGSGKTTLLQAMLAEVDPDQRLVIIEDSHELMIDHPHVVGLQTRTANVEAAGRIDLQDLVIQALRMRPDRLIVGECRGAELRDFLAAMNTGHQGAAGTLHANNPEAVPARLAALGALAGWGLQATSLQAASAVDLVIHMSRQETGVRSPVALGVLATDSQDRLLVSPLIDSGSASSPDAHGLQILGQKLGQQVAREVERWTRSRNFLGE
ncbi:TadA family conjugal transfer-associated ATPase [Glutamicibacter sp. NPDC087344]|uniref:TadA family conjugal transfer-associated ATPase n=1 Tax=Glutamicibacter sp. NPDC087344 TaxID=3363994 RepID=UPI003803DC33